MEVGHRDLGRGDQVQVVTRDDVHLVFLVRDLARAARGCGVDDRRRPHLGEAVLRGVDVEEVRDQAPLEARAEALVDREAGARDLGAARVVDDVERLAQLPVRLAGPGRAVGRRSVAGREIAPGPDGDVGLLAAHRDLGVGGVRDPQEQVLELRLGGGELGVDLLDPRAGGGRGVAKRLDLRPVGLGAAADGLADLLADGVALGLLRVRLRLEPATPRVDVDGPVDEARILAACRSLPGGSDRARRGVAGRRRSCERSPRRRPPPGGDGRRTGDRGWRGASRRAGRWRGRGTRGTGR